MASTDIKTAAACGIYRTTQALPAHAESVTADLLVYFHNHSDQGPPIIQMPEENKHNKWRFSKRGHLVTDLAWIATLAPLKVEGLWRLREHFHPDDDRVVAKNALVQLGYNRAAEPIVFFPRPIEDANGFIFPSRGTRVTPAIYDLLEPLDTAGPRAPTHVH